MARPSRYTIDDDAALTANTLAAVRVKCDGLFALSGEVLVEHQPVRTTTCQLHMRSFADGSTITIEPWKSGAFPIHDAALTANTLAAVRVKCDGLFALSGEVLVEHVQHLKEGHMEPLVYKSIQVKQRSYK
jgi:hypothetical protein